MLEPLLAAIPVYLLVRRLGGDAWAGDAATGPRPAAPPRDGDDPRLTPWPWTLNFHTNRRGYLSGARAITVQAQLPTFSGNFCGTSPPTAAI
jgi:hypothetical protein